MSDISSPRQSAASVTAAHEEHANGFDLHERVTTVEKRQRSLEQAMVESRETTDRKLDAILSAITTLTNAHTAHQFEHQGRDRIDGQRITHSNEVDLEHDEAIKSLRDANQKLVDEKATDAAEKAALAEKLVKVETVVATQGTVIAKHEEVIPTLTRLGGKGAAVATGGLGAGLVVIEAIGRLLANESLISAVVSYLQHR